MTGRTCRIAQTGLQGQSALGGPSFSCLWLVLWSKAKAKIQTTRNSCKKQRKRPLFKQKAGVLWSCYPDSNWGPHPYQLIGRMRFSTFQAYCALSGPECHPFRHSCVRYFRPLVSPCGSRCGSEILNLLQELRQHIKNDGTDHDPTGILIVMHQPVL